MIRVVVISLSKRFDNLRRPVRSVLIQAAKLLKLSDGVVEIYLTDRAVGHKEKFNVLSFPANKAVPRPDLEKTKALGEIYLNPAYIRQRQEDMGHMLIHGLLHLLGYDHIKKGDRIEMEKVEDRLLKRTADIDS